jgi:cytochrome P450
MILQEVDALGKDYVPSVSELLNMPYVDGVFKESLRLFPPGVLTAREIDQDCDLLGHRIEKGTGVHVRVPGLEFKSPEGLQIRS